MKTAYSYIRMSTETQLKGDSQRRQLEASKSYAKTHGLNLIESIDGILLQDLGISAFRGDNTKKGSLAIFIEALRAGRIEPNCVLLVESLDRLSRNRLTSALSQFMEILELGVEIVTLTDNQKYTLDVINLNPGALFVSLGIMFRANEESEVKSKRLSAAWHNKRIHGNSKVLTKNCPAWLQYSESSKKFEIVYGRDEVIKKIFDMCINTCGFFTIAKYLNENNVPVFGRGKLWRISYIKKIIINRAVLGELQPHHYIEGKRIAIGAPISEYFPKIIDEQTYLLAQSAVARRSNIGKGRKGSNFTNLFSGITYCGLCGYKMMVRNRGGEHSSSRYLLCSNNLVKAGCQMNGWNLNDFEWKLFNHLKEINFEDLLSSESKINKISLLDEIETLETKIKSSQAKTARALDTLIETDITNATKELFLQKIALLESEIKSAQDKLIETQKVINTNEESSNLFTNTKIKSLLAEMESKKDDYLFRSSMNQYLTKMVEKIELFEPIEQFMPWEFDEDSDEIKAFRLTSKSRAKKSMNSILESKDFNEFQRNFNRSIKIKYKTGAERYLMWGINKSLQTKISNQEAQKLIR